MTLQEIDRIKNAIRQIATAADVEPWAAEIAIVAMKKQIPEKAKYHERDKFVKGHFALYPICPTCNREIVAGDMHCSCGQAIDWEGWKEDG